MSKYIKTILINGLILFFMYAGGYLYPEYSWFVKALLYILLPANIIGAMILLNNNDKITDKMKKKHNSTPWNILDVFIDLIFILMIVLLKYKIIFVIFIIHLIFYYALKLDIQKLNKRSVLK
jgi:hypothetical protein